MDGDEQGEEADIEGGVARVAVIVVEVTREFKEGRVVVEGVVGWIEGLK